MSSSDANETIPADLLGGHRTANISLYCPPEGNNLLRVDSEAFRASSFFTQVFYSFSCDLSRLDLQFLDGFKQLKEITIRYSSNVGWAKWGYAMPNLDKLRVEGSTGLNEWTKFPKLTKGLRYVEVNYNDIQDEAMNRLLSSLATTSANTLIKLSIFGNDLTNVPKAPFNTHTIHLGNQQRGIPVITAGSFNLTEDGAYCALSLDNNKIQKVEAGAFQGELFLIHIFIIY